MAADKENWIAVYLKGVFMGAADTVPGISGGTIALITGIYDRLIQAIAALDPSLIAPLRHIHTVEGREAFQEEVVSRDLQFLAVLGLGIVTAVILLSSLVHTALTLYPAPMNAVFFGLIFASAVVLYRQVTITTLGQGVAAVLGFGAAFIISGVAATTGFGHTLPVIFLSGLIASAAMILPGISGAAFLYLFGQYTFLTGTLKQFVTSMFSGAAAVTEGVVVAVFLTGAAIGVVTVARIVRWALHQYRTATLAALISLMVGALRMPVEAVARADPLTSGTAAIIISAAFFGALIVLGLDRATEDIQYM